MSLIGEIQDYLSLGALGGTVLLTPLYLSQRRDLIRLREFKERDPDHARRDFAASEALLDRAEADLEAVLIKTGEFQAVTGVAPSTDPGGVAPLPPSQRLGTGATPIPPLSRVTSDRPALERVTMERDALAPHARWRRFTATATRPRVLAVLGLLAVAIGIGALVASGTLIGGNEPQRAAQPSGGAAAKIGVAVLNGTSVAGLQRRVGDDVKKGGFTLGTVANSKQAYQQTVVMYSPGMRKAATKVAHVLGVTPIQPIDSTTRAQARDADVVVIAGTDRAKP